jgi:hypothetical protein
MARFRNQEKHGERMRKAQEKPTPSNYCGCILFEKNDMRGRLSIFENCFEWEVFGDAEYQQHLDWNKPECKIFDGNDMQILFFEAVKIIHDIGFTQRDAYFNLIFKLIKINERLINHS